MGLILDRQQLSEALGVSESAIGSWEKKGCPTRRKGRGRGMKSLYDFDAVHAWCKQTGHGCGIQTLIAAAGRAPGASPQAPAANRYPPSPALPLAGVIAGAMVDWLKVLPSWDYMIPVNDMAELVDLYICELTRRLAAAGYGDVDDELATAAGEDAWPATLEACIARAKEIAARCSRGDEAASEAPA